MLRLSVVLFLFLTFLLAARTQKGQQPAQQPQSKGRRDHRACQQPQLCNPEKAQARCVKIIQEWSSYVNTGNVQYLINNYIQVGASVTTTGTVNSNLCNVVTADLGQQLKADVVGNIKGDVLTIKEVKYLPKNGHVEVYFTQLQGVDAANMTLVSSKWLFKAQSDCDYKVADQQNTFFPCL